MVEVTIFTHFSIARWPLVNKMSGIAKCLNVDLIHCPKIELLKQALTNVKTKKVLLLTDDGMIDYILALDKEVFDFELEIAVFIQQKLSKFAEKINQLSRVRYLLEFDEKDAFVGRHLAILVKKVKDNNILDLNKYLGFGAAIQSKTVNSKSSKQSAVEEISFFIENLGDPKHANPFKEYARRITEMVDELIINAIFGANPRMKDADRSEDFRLGKEEEVYLSWGYDGEYFGVSVRDMFGQFSVESIMQHLSMKPEFENIVQSKSAGLGQKLVVERAHQIITNVQVKKITEVIAIVKFENRLLDYERTKKSFFYFTEGNGAIFN
ncbi:MAG: hypothetical protein AB7N80_11590 [Bdellovibrionales bacterium]